MTMTRYCFTGRPWLLSAMLATAVLQSAEPAKLPFKPSPVPGGVAVIALPAKAATPVVTYRCLLYTSRCV